MESQPKWLGPILVALGGLLAIPSAIIGVVLFVVLAMGTASCKDIDEVCSNTIGMMGAISSVVPITFGVLLIIGGVKLRRQTG